MPATLDARLVGNPLLTGEVRVRFIEMGLKHLVNKAGDRRNPGSLLAALVAAAGGANGVLPSGVRVGDALAGLSNGELARAANAHAEPYSSFMAVSAQSVNTVARRAIERAMVTHRSACPAGDVVMPSSTAQGATAAALPGALACTGGRVAWIDAGSTQGQVGSQADLAGFGYRVREQSAGLDLWGDTTRALGVFLGRTQVTMDEHDFVASRFSREGWQLGAYANWRPDSAWSLGAAAGWTHGDINAVRTISDVGQLRGGVAQGTTRSHGQFAGFQLQRRMPASAPVAWWAPTASVRWSSHRMAGLAESGGGDFGFRIESAATRSLVTALGLEGGFGWFSGNSHWTLAASARYEQDHAAQSRAAHEVTATHALYGRFTQVGANAGAYAAVAGLTLGMRFAPQGVFALTATQAERQYGRDQSLRASLDWRW
ncbi:MAG: autotransporter outer membrane beta-barrel domain-containing protein, partial [Rubrivivax sp.]